MTQHAFAALPDLREIRTRFLSKQLAYALSFHYELPCSAWRLPNVQGALGASAAKRPERTLQLSCAKNDDVGLVFHAVSKEHRVPGIDKLGHELPNEFRVRGTSERVVFRAPQPRSGKASAGYIDGRALFETPESTNGVPREQVDGQALRISVTYGGTLQFEREMDMSDPPPKSNRASAFITTFFETAHPKYHWLTENTSIAFGTWELKDNRVYADFDVYCAA